MTNIFLSYRAHDSVYLTDRLSAMLADHFGRRHVFRDQDSLLLGALYPQRIRHAMQRCTVMIAVIGPHWLDARLPNGARRIDDPKDWVRMELCLGFDRAIPVIPVLLDGTALPTAAELPADIGKLAHSQYWQIRHQSTEADIRELIDKLDPEAGPPSPVAPVDVPNTKDNNTQYNVAGEHGTIISNNGSGTARVRMKRNVWR
ncbi:MAG TPA: toll/interleukin-1 receptor domain-containing protein [Pseudonocardiaceae bacterium]|nr:toll/interleukin-1 receptor domain-containing protein [Pseudonocardiaceae bacterium]